MMKHILALTVILSLGTTVVYAEDSTIQVPFNYHGTSCWYDEVEIEYHCTWQGEREIFTEEDLEHYKDLLSDEVYAEELEKLQRETIVIEETKLTPREITVQELEKKLNNGDAEVKDSVLYHLLTQLDTCTQGMDRQTAPFQTAREFEISNFKQWSMNNIPYEEEIGTLVMAIEECRAQQTLLKIVGEGYSGMPTGDNDVQFSLYEEWKGIQAISFDQYNNNSFRIELSDICENNQYTQNNKELMGCPERLYNGLTMDQIERQNEVMFGNSGMIHYQNNVIDKYNDFMENYGNRSATNEDKAHEEAIAEPIVEKMLLDNIFVQNKIKRGD
jgi:hypothetical protein